MEITTSVPVSEVNATYSYDGDWYYNLRVAQWLWVYLPPVIIIIGTIGKDYEDHQLLHMWYCKTSKFHLWIFFAIFVDEAFFLL